MELGRFSWKVGFCGRGCVWGGGRSLIDDSPRAGDLSVIPPAASEAGAAKGIGADCSGRARGGSLTMGRDASRGKAPREIAEPVGDTRKSRPISGAIDDRRLRAMLGE